MSRQATPAPQTPHPRGHAAAPRGIKFPISKFDGRSEKALNPAQKVWFSLLALSIIRQNG